MDLDFSEEQQMLREMTRGVLAEHCSLDVVRALEDDPVGYPAELWKQLGELGLTGLGVPEAYGGGGQTLLEGAILYEELGRALAPSPHFASAVVCAGVLLAAGSEAQRKAWLPRVAAGEAILTPAWLEPRRGFGPAGVALRARRDADPVVLSGEKWLVPFARAATQLVVLGRTGEAPEDVDLFLVDPGAPGVALEQQRTLGSDAQYAVSFRDVRVPVADRIGAPGSGWRTWNPVLLDGLVLLAAQAIGGAERALELTVDYARERKQFDKPLGAFQSISHYLADAATAIDGGRTLVYEAAWARSQGRPIERLAPMAKLFACRTFRDATATFQQIWGGVGFTIEYDIQLFFRRAKQLQLSWGDEPSLEARVAEAVLEA